MDKILFLIYGVTWLVGISMPFIVLWICRTCNQCRSVLRLRVSKRIPREVWWVKCESLIRIFQQHCEYSHALTKQLNFDEQGISNA